MIWAHLSNGAGSEVTASEGDTPQLESSAAPAEKSDDPMAMIGAKRATANNRVLIGASIPFPHPHCASSGFKRSAINNGIKLCLGGKARKCPDFAACKCCGDLDDVFRLRS